MSLIKSDGIGTSNKDGKGRCGKKSEAHVSKLILIIVADDEKFVINKL